MNKSIFLFLSIIGLALVSQVCGYDGYDAKATVQINSELIFGEQKTVTLKITGMTCAGCANNISSVLEKMEGVISEEIEYPGDVNTVTYDPQKTNEKEIIAAIEKIGYKANVIKAKNNKTK